MACTRPFLPTLACTLVGIVQIGRQASASPFVCLRNNLIERTDKPEDNTIPFVMLDHSMWRNHLPQRCTGLTVDPNGFTYMPTNPATDEICFNLVTIGLSTVKTVCALGEFSRFDPAQHH